MHQKVVLPGGSHIGMIVPDLGLQIRTPASGQLTDLAGGTGIEQAFQARISRWIQPRESLEIWKNLEPGQKRPDPSYSSLPFAGRSEKIMEIAAMAFCVDQAAGTLEKPVCCLIEKEMLP